MGFHSLLLAVNIWCVVFRYVVDKEGPVPSHQQYTKPLEQMGPTFLLLLASMSGQCGCQFPDLRHHQFVPSAQGLNRQGNKLYPLAPAVLQQLVYLPG